MNLMPCRLNGMRGNRRDDDGAWIVDCCTHGWTGVYSHNGYFAWRCPIGRILDYQPPDYSEFLRNQAHIRKIDGRYVWIDGPTLVAVDCKGGTDAP
jgi:hypothetical protein